jgi:hypothetical protein
MSCINLTKEHISIFSATNEIPRSEVPGTSQLTLRLRNGEKLAKRVRPAGMWVEIRNRYHSYMKQYFRFFGVFQFRINSNVTNPTTSDITPLLMRWTEGLHMSTYIKEHDK